MTTRPRAAAGSASGPSWEAAVTEALDQIERDLSGVRPDLVVAFVGGAYADGAEGLSARIRQVLEPRCLIGVTAGGVVAGSDELETGEALSLWAVALPNTRITSLRYPPPLAEGQDPAGSPGWPEPPDDARGMIVFADPFTFPADSFLAWTEHARPGLTISGGIASAGHGPGGNRLLLDGEVHEHGAVAVALAGDVRLNTLVSQGCRPVGPDFVVTRAQRNLIEELAGAPPVDRIREVYAAADERDQRLMRRGLHVGRVLDEYREEFTRGDFLVRGVIGAHPETGAIAVGDLVNVGQTVRFHVQDADSADEDLRELLSGFRATGDAALLFTCNGRGAQLFGSSGHDAALVSDALDGIPLAGAFCAGELGPVGSASFLHGFTASLLVLECGEM